MALSIKVAGMSYDVETYFCDPFASWQKGGVENANKLKLLTKWCIENLIIRSSSWLRGS